MERRIWLGVLIIGALVFVAAGQKPTSTVEPAYTRYELIAASQEQEGKMVFVIDRQTGRAWKYGSGGDVHGVYMSDHFSPVEFGIAIQGQPNWGMKGSASEDH